MRARSQTRDGRPVLIRESDESDMDSLCALAGEGRTAVEQRLVQELVVDGGGCSLVVEIESVVAGHVLLAGPRDPLAPGEVALAVAEGWRGIGLGALLLEAAIAVARDAGLECVWLEVDDANVTAGRLYRRAGFVSRGESRQARGRRMELRLD